MLVVPGGLQNRFSELLTTKAIPPNRHGAYRKWLCFYLDFCKKYTMEVNEQESLVLFIKKLKEKRQSSEQQQQAVQAIRLFYQIDITMLPQTAMETAQPQVAYRMANSRQLKEDCNPSKFSDQRRDHLGKADFIQAKSAGTIAKQSNIAQQARENCQSVVRPLPKLSQLIEMSRMSSRQASWKKVFPTK
jgi:hypothetical protein